MTVTPKKEEDGRKSTRGKKMFTQYVTVKGL